MIRLKISKKMIPVKKTIHKSFEFISKKNPQELQS